MLAEACRDRIGVGYDAATRHPSRRDGTIIEARGDIKGSFYARRGRAQRAEGSAFAGCRDSKGEGASEAGQGGLIDSERTAALLVLDTGSEVDGLADGRYGVLRHISHAASDRAPSDECTWPSKDEAFMWVTSDE